MGFLQIEEQECLCAFVQTFGTAKKTVGTFLDSLIAILNTVKALLLLVPMSLEDELRKLQYQAELAALEVAANAVEAPFELVNSYMKLWADCPPVKTASKAIKDARDATVGPIKDMQFEIENYIAMLKEDKLKIAKLNRLIDILQTLKDAIDNCGQ